ncbi:integrase core domain-containing protein [Nonomuraea sp. AD125B]|uniref:integrase core domain-containing protein n=1 Tax=Nonomuraea sp. AD125B TaxID=3242897 RepID=UPI00352700DF
MRTPGDDRDQLLRRAAEPVPRRNDEAAAGAQMVQRTLVYRALRALLLRRRTAILLAAGIDASIGTVGDALDNALVESQIGLYKIELIKPRGPWRSLADVELVTAEWVAWFNSIRPYSAIGHLPPEEFETISYAQHRPNEALAINR